MASITIRDLNDNVKMRLRMRAAVSSGKAGPRDLAKFTRECFVPLGGVELELPPRGPMREPPDLS